MTTIKQLDPPLPLIHTPTGRCGLAHLVIDYGVEIDLMWVLAFDDNGEMWCVPNPQVRLQFNWTFGRGPSHGPKDANGQPEREVLSNL